MSVETSDSVERNVTREGLQKWKGVKVVTCPKYEVIKNDKATCQRSSGGKNSQTSASKQGNNQLGEWRRSNVTTANINAAQISSKIKELNILEL